MKNARREPTRAERAATRKLVKDLCANYSQEYGCLLLDGDCYLFTNSGMCSYFEKSVLPTDPILQAALTGGAAIETRVCAICGEIFPAYGKKAYCADVCANEAKKRKQRGYMRERRSSR